MRREKGFSGFIGETVDLFTDNIGAVALFIAVVGGLTAAGVLLGFVDSTQNMDMFGIGMSVSSAMGLNAALFEIVTSVIAVIAAYFLATKYLESRGRLAPGGTRIWAYVGLSILSIIGIVFGLILLIIPGIILLVRWSGAVGFLLGEREGIVDSLKASWEATRGSGWAIFFAALVMFVGLALLGGIIGGAMGALGSLTGILIVSAFAEALGNAFTVAFGIAVYCLVHDDSGEVSEVFS